MLKKRQSHVAGVRVRQLEPHRKVMKCLAWSEWTRMGVEPALPQVYTRLDVLRDKNFVCRAT